MAVANNPLPSRMWRWMICDVGLQSNVGDTGYSPKDIKNSETRIVYPKTLFNFPPLHRRPYLQWFFAWVDIANLMF